MRQAVAPLGRRAVRLDARKAGTVTFTAPIKGLVTNQNLSNAPKEAAFRLDNWFPTQTGVRLRGGTALFATIGTGPVLSMWNYVSGNVEKLFAADAANIFDITAPADPEVAPTAAIGSLTGGYWTFVQFETAGGDFLVGCNGADTPRQFDGTTWTSSTMTGSGLTTSNLSHVWAYKSRLYFIEDGTMKFWYLPVDSITGTATQFSLAGVFNKGGSLLFGATWSLDAGDGVDDLLVVVSTLGEVAVYQGSDPSSDFQLVGVYQISVPLGKDATVKAGGDLLIATVEGIVPISVAVNKDASALSLSAVTRNIEPTWVAEVADRGSLPWTMVKWPEKNMLVVGMPTPGGAVQPFSFVANLETGAWCCFTGANWDIRSQSVLEGVHYVGGATGKVYITESGGSDTGSNYTSTCVYHFSHLGRRGPVKSVNLARATFRATRAFEAKVSCSINYALALPSAPSSVADSTEDAWDEGVWDTAIWDASGSSLVTAKWTAISKAGYVIAPQVQVTSGVTPRPDAELMSIDVQYELGAVVV
jgi:hypothetical protein